MNKNLLALFGLTFNPFAPEVPMGALRLTTALESFFWKIQQSLLREGGFALIVGEAGTGKSVALRLLAHQLAHEPELFVGAISRPHANVADFYRELGEVLGVPLRPHNRWSGSKALRERWTVHIETTLMRPVLLVELGAIPDLPGIECDHAIMILGQLTEEPSPPATWTSPKVIHENICFLLGQRKIARSERQAT